MRCCHVLPLSPRRPARSGPACRRSWRRFPSACARRRASRSSTPAANPSTKNSRNSQGSVPISQSKPTPMKPPTITAPTSSAAMRMPYAMPRPRISASSSASAPACRCALTLSSRASRFDTLCSTQPHPRRSSTLAGASVVGWIGHAIDVLCGRRLPNRTPQRAHRTRPNHRDGTRGCHRNAQGAKRLTHMPDPGLLSHAQLDRWGRASSRAECATWFRRPALRGHLE